MPFNFLQPIVENAFIHGFAQCVRKKLKLVIVGEHGRIGIKIVNSGKQLSAQGCYKINQGILSNTSHGLSIIYHKLHAVYEGDCTFKICSEKNSDTYFLIQIPIRPEGTERRLYDSGSDM